MAAPPHLSGVAILVRDYDEALAFYTNALGFSVLADQAMEGGKRWVQVAPPGGGTALLLARAQTAAEKAAVGNQCGGRVFLFLHTDDFARDFARMRKANVHFEEVPRQEAYGTVAVFRDLYGNRWDLIEPLQPGGM